MPSFQEEKYKQQIKALVDVKMQDSDRPLTLYELEELASSMGVSPSEWRNLLKEADNHLYKSEGHLKARNFIDAIDEGEKATSINPYIKDGNSILAQAYLMQWLKDNDNVKRDKAEFYARRELKIDAHDQRAINVLSTVQNKKHTVGNGKNLRVFALAGIVLLAGFGMAVFTFIGSNENPSEVIDTTDHTLNSLIEAEEEVKSKWGLVENALDRRNKIIPDLLNELSLSTSDLNEEIKEIENKIQSPNISDEERYLLESQLEEKINLAKIEINTNGNHKNSLIIQIEGAENRINFAKREYNEAVKNYNILVKQSQNKYPEYKEKSYF